MLICYVRLHLEGGGIPAFPKNEQGCGLVQWQIKGEAAAPLFWSLSEYQYCVQLLFSLQYCIASFPDIQANFLKKLGLGY